MIDRAITLTNPDSIIFMSEEPVAMARVTVNEGFLHMGDRAFISAHPDIINCNKGDEQHTAFYFNILEEIEE